jgi:hypothetical protein
MQLVLYQLLLFCHFVAPLVMKVGLGGRMYVKLKLVNFFMFTFPMAPYPEGSQW